MLAIINGRTFAKGEKGEVPTPGGAKVQITVLDIDETYAVIEIGGEQRKLEFQVPK